MKFLKHLFNKIERHADQIEKRLGKYYRQYMWQSFILTQIKTPEDDIHRSRIQSTMDCILDRIDYNQKELFNTYKVLYGDLDDQKLLQKVGEKSINE